MNFLPEVIETYALEHTSPVSEVLQELERETYAKVLMPRMLSGVLQGQTLSFLSQFLQPKWILEIGTYTGYSAICLAQGLQKEGQLVTIDINDELNEMVLKYVTKAGYQNTIQTLNGNAIDLIPTLTQPWDLVFLDADKENYLNYYNLLLPNLKSGAVIIADNVLWSGKVCLDESELANNDKDTKALKKFNTFVQEDNRVENLLLPIRDGLLLIRKK